MTNFPARAPNTRRNTRNFRMPSKPTSTSAVGSRSSGPTSFSPRAIFASRSFLRSSQALCSSACLSVYCLYLQEPVKQNGPGHYINAGDEVESIRKERQVGRLGPHHPIWNMRILDSWFIEVSTSIAVWNRVLTSTLEIFQPRHIKCSKSGSVGRENEMMSRI